MDEGFESDDEYERRRHAKSSKCKFLKFLSHTPPRVRTFENLKDETSEISPYTTTTIIKTVTLEEPIDDDRTTTTKRETCITITDTKPSSIGMTIPLQQQQQIVTPQFKQLEPLKMVKRDLSKELITSSSSASSADTIVTVGMRDAHSKTIERGLG